MRPESIIGALALAFIGVLVLALVLLCILAAALTIWGCYELSTNPDAKISSADYQELQRSINDNQSRIVNAIPGPARAGG